MAMLLGRTVWTRADGMWRSEASGAAPEPAVGALPRLAEALSARPGRSVTVVYEPEGMAHQLVETPRVKRTVFASLERMRSEHPVVSSETLGWGIDPPEPGAGGAFYTQLHSEPTPGLIGLRDACSRSGSHLSAAWSAYTVAAGCAGPLPEASIRYVLLMTRDFSAVACCGARRSFRGWTGRMSEKDWRAASVLLGDAEGRPSPSRADAEFRRRSMIVVAAGDPAELCPLWGELRDSGRVEAVLGLEEFAAAAARLPRSHPANLLEGFPRKLSLDGCLAAAGIAGMLAAAALGAAAAVEAGRFDAARAAALARLGALRGRLLELEGNQREMARLREEAPEGLATPSSGHAALEALGSTIPDALTLTSFALGPDGHFRLEAMVVGPGFDPEGTRLALARSGLAPVAGGWSYDPASGLLRVHGSRVGTQP